MDTELIFDLVNQEREEAGLKPLIHSRSLTESSALKAYDMCEFNYWSHDNPNGTKWQSFIDPKYEKVGENLARDFDSEQELVLEWMHSPEHKQNILGDYTESGVHAIVCGKKYAVQHFGKPPVEEKSDFAESAPMIGLAILGIVLILVVSSWIIGRRK